VEDFKYQWFDWSKEKRLEFLQCRAEQKGFKIENDLLGAQAEEAYNADQNIREMDFGLATATTHIYKGDLEETQEEQSYLCAGCPIL
jgi:hypothetical protein